MMKNRIWLWDEPGDEDGRPDLIEKITDQEILALRWNIWKEQMIKKYGADSELITEENCIQDWVTTNWAWEWKDET